MQFCLLHHFESQLKTICINTHWNQYQFGGLIKVHGINNISLGRLHKHVILEYFSKSCAVAYHGEIQNTEIYA